MYNIIMYILYIYKLIIRYIGLFFDIHLYIFIYDENKITKYLFILSIFEYL